MKKTLIDLIRHGEPVDGLRYRGTINDPLSDTGWQQMWRSVGHNPPWNVIISSPLIRCCAFAQILSEKYSIPETEDKRLQEVGFGEWEGKSAAELQTNDPECVRLFRNNPVTFRPPGAEPILDFQKRVVNAFEDIVKKHEGQHLLLVIHAGVIRMIIMHLLKIPLEAMYGIHTTYAGISRVKLTTGEQPSLVFHNRDQL